VVDSEREFLDLSRLSDKTHCEAQENFAAAIIQTVAITEGLGRVRVRESNRA